MTRPPVPPFSRDDAILKVRMAEDAWNGRDPARVALAYTPDTVWRNRSDFLHGHDQVQAFLARKWQAEQDYRLIKALWCHAPDCIAVRFCYEWHDAEGRWFRSNGNENWQFDASGLMAARHASINDVAIGDADRLFRWPQGPRPADHPGLTHLGLEPPSPQGDDHERPDCPHPDPRGRNRPDPGRQKGAGPVLGGIVQRIGMSQVFTHSACMGINAFPFDKAQELVTALDLPADAADLLSAHQDLEPGGADGPPASIAWTRSWASMAPPSRR